MPKLEKLRAAKRVYTDFCNTESQLSQHTSIITAYTYHGLSNKLQTSEENIGEMQEHLSRLEKITLMCKEEIETFETEFAELNEKKSGNLSSSESTAEVEYKVKSKEVVKVRTLVSLAQNSMQDDLKTVENLAKSLGDAKKNIVDCKLFGEVLEKDSKNTIDAYNDAIRDVEGIQNLLQGLTTGLASNKGGENGYLDQLATNKKALSESSCELKTLEMSKLSLTKEVSDLQPDVLKAETANLAIEIQVRLHNDVVTELLARLENEKLDTDFDKQTLLESRALAKQNEMQDLAHEIEVLERSCGSAQFDYKNPSKDFDRSSVKGVVATLLSVKSTNLESIVALEGCAGAKIYNVIHI